MSSRLDRLQQCVTDRQTGRRTDLLWQYVAQPTFVNECGLAIKSAVYILIRLFETVAPMSLRV